MTKRPSDNVEALGDALKNFSKTKEAVEKSYKQFFVLFLMEPLVFVIKFHTFCCDTI